MTYYQVRFEKRAQKTLKKMDSYQANMIMAWIKKHLVETTNPRIHGKGLREIDLENGDIELEITG